MHTQPPARSPHFFEREPDGSVRLRIRFTPDEANLIEEGAGAVPLMPYIHDALRSRARLDIEARDAADDAHQPHA